MNAPNFTDETTRGVNAKQEAERIVSKLESLGAFLFKLQTPKGDWVAIAYTAGNWIEADLIPLKTQK